MQKYQQFLERPYLTFLIKQSWRKKVVILSLDAKQVFEVHTQAKRILFQHM